MRRPRRNHSPTFKAKVALAAVRGDAGGSSQPAQPMTARPNFIGYQHVHITIFDTPIVNAILRHLSIGFMRTTGWKVEGSLPAGDGRVVMIAAPHTSNWDLPYMLMVAFILRLNVYWMGKASIFSPPFGSIMKWLGGIPVNREQSTNVVATSAEALTRATGPMQLVVPPEGTRSKTRSWRTGFYYIALGAKVPIVMAYMDYQRKLTGLGPTLYPSGDIDADMKIIKAFYAPFRGKNAAQFEAAQ